MAGAFLRCGAGGAVAVSCPVSFPAGLGAEGGVAWLGGSVPLVGAAGPPLLEEPGPVASVKGTGVLWLAERAVLCRAGACGDPGGPDL